ncbi:hypothetical protein [Thermanaeromonas sp. C210]|uniref:hypothetical protein n=1 Tax=Thermanaeromonas sp. C210 TaxID=2731925 RepID=UPI00155B6F20|nr:hypothetical protein [Thermanaeromonas sp. C210]GFN23746.1 hypothetical protein TAMC210_20630 [Thermanaeromonas sp. C210]
MDLILSAPGQVRAGGQATLGLPPSRHKGGLPAWRVGQVIGGRVLARISANSYLLVVEGQEVLARSAFSLEAGQFVVMEVQEFRDSRYMVRLLSPGPEQKEKGEEAMKSLPHQLGLKDTPVHRALIQAFIAQKLPLTAGRIKEAALMLGFLQARAGEVPSPEEIATVLHALKRELPPRPEVLQALHAFVNAEKEGRQGTMTRLVSFLFSASPVLEEFLTDAQGRSLWLQLKAAAKALVLRPHEGPAGVAEQLRSLLGAQLPRAEPSHGYEEGIGKGFEGRRYGEVSPPGRDLPTRLRQFIRHLDQYEATGEKPAFLASIKEEGHGLARQLWGQYLWQTGKGEGEAYLYFSLPVLLDGQILKWGELLIKKDRGSTVVIDPQDFTVTILLHTRHLGTLSLEIRVRKSEVTVQGKVEYAWVGRLLDSSWSTLEEALEGLGYRLHKATWAVCRVTSIFNPQGTPGSGTAPGVISVDVKV